MSVTLISPEKYRDTGHLSPAIKSKTDNTNAFFRFREHHQSQFFKDTSTHCRHSEMAWSSRDIGVLSLCFRNSITMLLSLSENAFNHISYCLFRDEEKRDVINILRQRALMQFLWHQNPFIKYTCFCCHGFHNTPNHRGIFHGMYWKDVMFLLTQSPFTVT
jgi:hypothetical protein